MTQGNGREASGSDKSAGEQSAAGSSLVTGHSSLIAIDAGHGKIDAGRYDPGAVRWSRDAQGRKMVEATESDLALQYAVCLDEILRRRGSYTALTRTDQTKPCPLLDRARIAKRAGADLLISLHLNADPDPDGPGDPEGRGHEILWRTRASAPIARAISDALKPIIPPHGAGVVERPRLALLAYDPSVIVELAFIDSSRDYAALIHPGIKLEICKAIAGAVQSHFHRGDAENAEKST
jgi:N-acetylmuramoyl-L-alanine amidase